MTVEVVTSKLINYMEYRDGIKMIQDTVKPTYNEMAIPGEIVCYIRILL